MAEGKGRRKGKDVFWGRSVVKVGTLNFGTLSGRVREQANVMERRKKDIFCVQEIRWKGITAGTGHGFKLFYHGVRRNRNGIKVILKE